jgi:hypothetical protein
MNERGGYLTLQVRYVRLWQPRHIAALDQIARVSVFLMRFHGRGSILGFCRVHPIPQSAYCDVAGNGTDRTRRNATLIRRVLHVDLESSAPALRAKSYERNRQV